MQQVCSNCRATQAMLMGNAYYCVSCGQPWRPLFINPNNTQAPSSTPVTIPETPIQSNLQAPGREYARSVYAPAQPVKDNNVSGVVPVNQSLSNYNSPDYQITNLYNPAQDPEVSGLSQKLRNTSPANKAHKEALDVLEKSFTKKIEPIITTANTRPQISNPYLAVPPTANLDTISGDGTRANYPVNALPKPPETIPAVPVYQKNYPSPNQTTLEPQQPSINPISMTKTSGVPVPPATPISNLPQTVSRPSVPTSYNNVSNSVPNNPTLISVPNVASPISIPPVPPATVDHAAQQTKPSTPPPEPPTIISQTDNLLTLSNSNENALEAKNNLDKWFSDLGDDNEEPHTTPEVSTSSKWDKLSTLFSDEDSVKQFSSPKAQQDRLDSTPSSFPESFPNDDNLFKSDFNPVSPLIEDAFKDEASVPSRLNDNLTPLAPLKTDKPVVPSIKSGLDSIPRQNFANSNPSDTDDQAADIFNNYQFSSTIKSKGDRIRQLDNTSVPSGISEIKLPRNIDSADTVPAPIIKKTKENRDTDLNSAITRPSEIPASIDFDPSADPNQDISEPLQQKTDLMQMVSSLSAKQTEVKNSIPQISKLGMVLAAGISLIIFGFIFWNSFSSQIAFKLTSSNLGLNVQTPENLPLKLKVADVKEDQETLMYSLKNRDTTVHVIQQKTSLSNTELINTVISTQAPTYLTKEIANSEVFILDNRTIYWIKDGLLSKIKSDIDLSDSDIEALVKGIN